MRTAKTNELPHPDSIAGRINALPWDNLHRSLSKFGYAVTPPILDAEQCIYLRSLFTRDELFRSRVIMEQLRFGRGDYKYFSYPLPQLVQEIRTCAFPYLAHIANEWAEFLNETTRFPEVHEDFLKLCHSAGQTRPTPLLLHYEEDGYNCLHQDIYGAIAFPLQMVFLLGQQGGHWEGGEFVLVEQRPRVQSRVEVLAPDQGCAVIFSTRRRPVRADIYDAVIARRGKQYYLAAMKHGVARVRRGSRDTLGIIFHDAE